MSEEQQTDISKVTKVQGLAELVKRLCLALTNVEMFSADHPVAKEGIDHAYEWLQGVLKRFGEDVVITVSGATVILDGVPLEERNPLVSKLAKRFDEVHISNIFFMKGIAREEFHEFYKIIGKGPKGIAAEGGIEALFKKYDFRHIELKDVSYVMVTGDEKVVSKDAHVVEGGAIAGVDMDSDIVKYMVGKVLEKADEQKWLLNEMKNNPEKMADMITSGIDLATSRAEMGMDEDGGIGALVSNIRLVGNQLMQEADDGEGGEESQKDLEKSLLTLENELRLRSSKMMSSKVAQGFVNEILGVVTSYSDNVRAKQITDEFLRGEKSLKKTEALLRDMVPEGEDQGNFVLRIADQLSKRGMSEEDLAAVLDQVKEVMPEEEEGAEDGKEAPPKKEVSDADISNLLSKGLKERLEAVGLQGEQVTEAVKSVQPYIEAIADDKAAPFVREAEHLREEVDKHEHMLKEVPMGVIMWDGEGKVEMINEKARELLDSELGFDLNAALARRLREWVFPMTDVPDLMTEKDLTDVDLGLLMNVAKVLKDDDSEPYGVILLPLKQSG